MKNREFRFTLYVQVVIKYGNVEVKLLFRKGQTELF